MTPSRPRFALWPLAALPAAGLFALLATAAGVAEERPPSPSEAPRPTTPDPRIAPFDVMAEPGIYDDRQISFEAEYITTRHGDWSAPLGDRLRLLRRDGEVAVWTIDDRAFREILDRADRGTDGSILRAPKVTVFNQGRATILNRHRVFHVADVEKVEGAPPGIRPIVKAIDLGSRLDMRGTLLAHATRLSIDLSDSWLTAMETKSRPLTMGTATHEVQIQVPTVVERKCRMTTEIRPGMHLLISLGRTVTDEKVNGLPGAINDLFAAIGLPEPIRFTPNERLVIVTPRPIILESEEVPARSTAR